MNDYLWYKDAIFYEVYVRAFYDSNGDGHGDIRGLTAKLDYFEALGVDCLWLLPVYPSPLLDGGYDISDYYNIHPDYGSLDDFKTFLDEAHRRGLRVIADLVLNHTSSQHPWFQAARADRNSPYRNYYVWSDTDDKYQEARIIFVDSEKSNWTWDEQAGQYYWHRFYSSQPDLNYDNPLVRKEMLKVLDYWLKLGVDGFRADAVPYLYEREGTSCENLPQTHAFLRRIRRHIDKKYPGRIMLAEANQWPRELRRYFKTRKNEQFHMGFHFPLMPRIFMSLKRQEPSAIVEILRRTPAIPESTQWCLFLRNHDELTLEMVTPEERAWMWEQFAPDPRMRLNLGIRRRLAPLLNNDRRQIEMATSLLFTLPGSPILYYGDEIGMGDNIWLNDRDGVRTPMQWSAGRNGGFSGAEPDRLFLPPIDQTPYSYHQVNAESQMKDPHSLWHAVQRMIATRKAHSSAFGRGTFTIIPLGNKAILGMARQHGNETILAIHNFSAEAQTIEIDLSRVQLGQPVGGFSAARDLLSGEGIGGDCANPCRLSIAPFGYRWYLLTAETSN